ncbi:MULTISPECIES: bacteriocin fulvocin C-related protein [unclassified Flavobacterium]|uniref:bacteriocin fulvocin C-related protein n=1 Tax=unclassified Flavobacterium TaxID=196869 RepID=UPI0022256892|nr:MULTISPECIES: bacteriocin fulvocin C-related protein [unclassified Flavobacterium]
MSCSNEEQTTSVDQAKVEFVTQSKNSGVTKAAYRLLTPEEKYFIWNERIDYIIANEDLTTEQTAFMNELKVDLNSNVFLHNSTDNISFKSKYDNSKLEIFHPIQGYYYFGTLASMVDNGEWSSISAEGAASFYDSLVFSPGDPNDGNYCTCNQGSIVNPDCETDCPSGEQTNDCGFLWLWVCDGYMPVI